MSTERRVRYSKEAGKALRKMGSQEADRIFTKIEQLAKDPASLANNIKALKGSDLFRLRVGDYRVIYSDSLEVLHIIRVGHRREIYD